MPKPCPYRSRIQKAKHGRKLLAETEKRLGTRIRFVRGAESEFDPNEYIIRIGPQSKFRKYGIDSHWTNHLLFHEFGHAVIEAFRDQFDHAAERKVFVGRTSSHYPEGFLDRLASIDSKTYSRKSVTWYGKLHPEEAWAEAFSFVFGNVDDSAEPEEVIQQLAYVDWVIENIVRGKTRWGRFEMPTIPVECECGEVFDLECRKSSDTRGWEVDCPDCDDTLIL